MYLHNEFYVSAPSHTTFFTQRSLYINTSVDRNIISKRKNERFHVTTLPLPGHT